ncbi:hypothetical protein [Nocardioides lacusdianchii]|uniref:hypothetical protein n=1 Tax=Nocardioides lacusdianchii TaxID=2783664 RepID=UPI001CCECDCD|nr:hypothetical protein [Nocardioides lacusdianchii]
MGATEDTTGQRFSTLPAGVAVEDTIASVDTSRFPDPDDVRSVDQHSALRDD